MRKNIAILMALLAVAVFTLTGQTNGYGVSDTSFDTSMLSEIRCGQIVEGFSQMQEVKSSEIEEFNIGLSALSKKKDGTASSMYVCDDPIPSTNAAGCEPSSRGFSTCKRCAGVSRKYKCPSYRPDEDSCPIDPDFITLPSGH